jgi:serine protease Do
MRTNKRRRTVVRLFAAVLCGAFVGMAAGAAFYRQTRREISARPGEDAPDGMPPETVSSAFTYSVSDVSREVMPAVVAITNTSVQELESFFGYSRSYESVGRGSGIIIGANDKELYIATNNHVVSASQTLSVAFIDGTASSATVKGTDRENDLAVIAVQLSSLEEETRKAIRTAVLGDSTKVEVGQQVVAIGNALGYGQSVTSGCISALDRKLIGEDQGITLIQTDAAINPGNSGGALLNMKGELIGINSAKYASYDVEGIGYAIPISTASPILDDLIQIETRDKVPEKRAAYLGVVCRDVVAEAAEIYGMPLGAYVDEVRASTPAEAAGIRAGDIIVTFANRKIRSRDDLLDALSYYSAGEIVDVVVQRTEDGEYRQQTFRVLLARKKS